jgi:hypothetical protein
MGTGGEDGRKKDKDGAGAFSCPDFRYAVGGSGTKARRPALIGSVMTVRTARRRAGGDQEQAASAAEAPDLIE